MGQKQVSGLLSFTVYTRGFAPRHWVCGILEQQSGFFGQNNQVALLNPLGPNSDADVLISQLSVAPAAMRAGWEAVVLSGVFDGLHPFQAMLNTRRDVGEHGHLSANNTWNASYRGRDGQIHVLSIEFKVSAASQPRLAMWSTAVSNLSLLSVSAVSCVPSSQPGQLLLPFNGQGN